MAQDIAGLYLSFERMEQQFKILSKQFFHFVSYRSFGAS